MPLLIEEKDESTSIALSIKKALEVNPHLAILDSLASENMTAKQRSKLAAAITKKERIYFQLSEVYGKVVKPKYDVVIDFSTQEVSVLKLPDNRKLQFTKFVSKKGGSSEIDSVPAPVSGPEN